MSIKTAPRSEFDPSPPHNPALENSMMESVEWFSGSTDIKVTNSSEGRLARVKATIHPQEPLGTAGILTRWSFSRNQSEA